MTTLLLFAMLAQLKIGSGIGSTGREFTDLAPNHTQPPFGCSPVTKRGAYFNTPQERLWLCDGERWLMVPESTDRCWMERGVTKDEDQWMCDVLLPSLPGYSQVLSTRNPSVRLEPVKTESKTYSGSAAIDDAKYFECWLGKPCIEVARPLRWTATEVFRMDGEHDFKKCLPAMRDAIEAVRAAWAPRPPKPNADGTFRWQFSSMVAQMCSSVDSSGARFLDNCCIGPEPKQLRCRADEIERREEQKNAQAAKETAAIAALNAVDEACGEMR